MKLRISKRAWVVLALVLVALIPVAARFSGAADLLSPANLRAVIDRSGRWGPLAFVTLFVGAMLGQVPGVPFVIAAPALFQLPEAWVLCFGASNLAMVLNFAIARRFGGQPRMRIDRPRLRQIFAELDDHPIRTVALLRTVTVMFPPMTIALAMTGIRARDHAIGSMLGMVLPVTVILWLAAHVVGAAP